MHHEEENSDRRSHARFELLDYAIITEELRGDAVRSVVVDISLGGLQIRSRFMFEALKVYKLVIGRGESQPITIHAECRYSTKIEESDLIKTGFRFIPETAVERIEWVEYVHGVFKLQGEMLTS